MSRLYWTAGPDGTAHAQYRGQHFTLCKLRSTLERYAWPAQRKCRACLTYEEGIK